MSFREGNIVYATNGSIYKILYLQNDFASVLMHETYHNTFYIGCISISNLMDIVDHISEVDDFGTFEGIKYEDISQISQL